MARSAYLDCNATTPLRRQAREALLDALQVAGNASSVHAEGRGARQRIERAREQVAGLLQAEADGIVFTSGGTEANALALAQAGEGPVLMSAVEHPSVLSGATVGPVEIVPVDGDGIVDLEWLAGRLAAQPKPSLVSVMAANNETGVLQPLEDVARLCAAAAVPLHSDAVQLAGRLPFRPAQIGLDLATVSSHKLGGPPGAGALWHRAGFELRPLLRGGGQERKRRAGTENAPAIAGFGAAAAAAADEAEAENKRIRRLRDFIEGAVVPICEGTRVLGGAVARLPNTICLAVPGLSAETALIALDLEGVAVSSGAACSSGKVGPSHVLAAMGVEPALAGGALRLSLGWSTSQDEVETFVRLWRRLGPGLARRGRPSRAA